MTSGFEHQEPSTGRAFSRSAPRPQQTGVRLAKDQPAPAPQRPAERRTF